jgi:hypothetical protein
MPAGCASIAAVQAGPDRSRPRRRQGAALRVRSNLGEPAGVLSWERDFLLALAVEVLEDFVGNPNEEDE